eukprot:scaffold109935_cov32-Tisochrysis_lutea.AAC.1
MRCAPLVEHLLVVGPSSPLSAASEGSSRLETTALTPALLSSYPAERPFAPGAPAAAAFCFPTGVYLSLGPRPPPSYGCFTLTDESYSRLYAHALTVYTPVHHDDTVLGMGDRERSAELAPASAAAVSLERLGGVGERSRSEALHKLYSEEHYVSLGVEPPHLGRHALARQRAADDLRALPRGCQHQWCCHPRTRRCHAGTGARPGRVRLAFGSRVCAGRRRRALGLPTAAAAAAPDGRPARQWRAGVGASLHLFPLVPA